jgi:hypothetical protein
MEFQLSILNVAHQQYLFDHMNHMDHMDQTINMIDV